MAFKRNYIELLYTGASTEYRLKDAAVIKETIMSSNRTLWGLQILKSIAVPMIHGTVFEHICIGTSGPEMAVKQTFIRTGNLILPSHRIHKM